MDEIVVKVFGRLALGSLSLANGKELQVAFDCFSLIKPSATISVNLVIDLQM